MNYILLTIFFILFFIFFSSYYFQNYLIYPSFISKKIKYIENPKNYGIFFKEFFVNSDNNLLHCWFLQQKNYQNKNTIIYFGGNASNLYLNFKRVIKLFHKSKCNILLFDYRGYGRSLGSPSESGLIEDSKNVLNYFLKSKITKNKIYLLGFSLGGAVAIDLALKNQDIISGLIIENTFSSINDVIDDNYPIIKYFKFISINKWNNNKKLKQIKIPTLFLSSMKDKIINSKQMLKNYNVCKLLIKKIEFFSNGNHFNLINYKKYYESINKFIKKLC